VKADELLSSVFTDLDDTIDYNPDGKDLILTIFDYVEAMKCQLWEISFFTNLGEENGAHKNKPSKKQPLFVQTVRRVFDMYFRYIYFPTRSYQWY
jgi:hypothetical protein